MAAVEHIVGVIWNMPTYSYTYLQPATGETWVIDQFISNVSYNPQLSYEELTDEGHIPDVQWDFYDGTASHSVEILPRDAYLYWSRQYKLVITDSLYLRHYQAATSGQDVYYHGVVTADSGTSGGGESQSILQSVAQYAYLYIQPPTGETWELYLWASQGNWTGTTPEVRPYLLQLRLYGSCGSMIMQDATNPSFYAKGHGSCPKGSYAMDNDTYVLAYNYASARYLAFSILQVK